MISLGRLDTTQPYEGYLYAYPHKTAYRSLDPVPLREVWRDEPRDSLFLYLHVPFCEMRCGFCNLFTEARPRRERVARWLEALRRHIDTTLEALGEQTTFSRVALGGGTPTFLDPADLALLFDRIGRVLGGDAGCVPIAVETSPETSNAERLAVLSEHRVRRVSMGVQSFVDSEVRALGRRQQRSEVEAALGRLRDHAFPTLNLDLIYGIPGQTEQTVRASVDAALEWKPEELYLYPLYVRPLTGLGRSSRTWSDGRLRLYRVAREHLLSRGYEQVSMRMFRSSGPPSVEGPVYCCQSDGMVGLGLGARSYTRRLHYSFDYAVGRSEVQRLVDDWSTPAGSDPTEVRHGIWLDAEEQRRRWVIQSLLSGEGVSRRAYRERFDADVVDEIPDLQQLPERGLAVLDETVLRLTPAGYELSDAIGPWLRSPRVAERMARWSPR